MTDLVPTDERPRRVKPPGSGRKKGQKNRPITFAADAVRPLIPLARRRLRQLLHSENEEIVYKTATRILEHAYGRPMQHKVVGGDGQAPIKTETVRPDDRELAARIQMALEPPNKPAKDPPVSRLPRSRPSNAKYANPNPITPTGGRNCRTSIGHISAWIMLMSDSLRKRKKNSTS